MLTIASLNQYYGGSHILRDVSLEVRAAACTVLLGRNGVGKTTLLKTIMGLVPARGGSICRPFSACVPASATCRRAARSSTGSPSKRT
jgi:ABC-type branched-subunit amino acid transport system ATPase component